MAGLSRKVARRVSAISAVALAQSTRIMPLAAARAFARLCARIAYHAVPRVQQVGLDNLDLAYGDSLARDERARLLLRSVESVATVAAEFARTPRLKGQFLEDHVSVEGVDLIDRSRGVMLVTAHLGNWEWMAPALAAQDFRIAAIVRPLDDPILNRFVDSTRRAGGISTIPKENAGGEMLRLLREGWIVGVLADQSPRHSAAPVTFFGQPCWGTIAPVMAALRARVPVHAVFMPRQSDGRYRLTVGPPFDFVRTSNLHADLITNCQRVQDEIERIVRLYPDQWLWMHRRWKPRPALAAEWESRLGKGKTKI